MTQEQMYSIRDPQGNVYGPASAESLRQWAREGRIVPGMHLAPEGTNQWQEASTHPIVAAILKGTAASPAATQTTVEATRVEGTSTPVGFQSGVAGTGAGGMDPARLNMMGLLSFIFGCLSFPAFCCCFVGIPFSIVSIVLGILSLNQYKTHYGQYHSRWMAITGISISIVALLLSLLVFIANIISAAHK